ncbi:extracellular solute-binding protein [Bifidobacterium sp. 82T10]|uniref:Extracellular solute-binding protein n=1 Tax=Bifidobacterium miconis TaxID=2834435 RepID=A0ABS6WF44_9BIFI|nr:extracellular solute-binding protein [Bifidobacterium miconis]MBW3092472.1 extracellular solute-binding protein [Bifidobacterium miconis]
MAQERKPTIYSIAKEVGVSPSAVSRALHHPGRLNAKTEARIHQAAQRLGYLDDRSLAQAETSLIAIIVADISDPLTARIVDGARRRLAARGYHAMVIEEHDITTQDGLTAQFRKLPVCGLLLQSQTLREQEIRRIATSLPTVLIGRTVDGINSGTVATASAVSRMFDALRQTGHASLTYLVESNEGMFGEQLRRQIAEEAARRDMRLQLLLGCPDDAALAAGTVDRFLVRPTDAVFAANGSIAARFAGTLRQRDIAVPSAVSVIGFGHDPAAGLGLPSLARIACPMEDLGTDCAEHLISLIHRQTPSNAVRTATFIPADTLGRHEQSLSSPADAEHTATATATMPATSATSATPTAKVCEPTELTIMASSFQDWDRHINAYVALHPNLHVRRVKSNSQMDTLAEYYRRVRSGTDIPDVTVIEYRWLPQLAEDRMLLNLNTPAVRTIFSQQFVADCWNAVRYRDGIYGVPCDYDTTLLFCRTDLMDRFGVQIPRTWQEMLDMGEAIHRQDPSQYAMAFNTIDAASLIALLYMASAQPWSYDPSDNRIRLALDGDAAQSAAALIQQGIDRNILLPMNFNTDRFRDIVAQNRITTIFSANWFCENIAHWWPQQRGLWKVMLPPSFSDPASLITAHLGGSAWTISNRIPASRRNAAMQFALWTQADPASVDLQLDRILSATTYFHRNTKLTGKIDPFFGQKLYDVFFEASEHVSRGFAYLPFMPQVEALFADTVLPQLVPGGDLPGHLATWQTQIANFAQTRGYQVDIVR